MSTVCTIGEKCCEEAVLEQMLEAGMRAARFDMKDGDSKDQLLLLRKMKNSLTDIASKHKRVIPVAIIGDIKGPQVLTGKLYKAEKIFLKRGGLITLTTHPGWDLRGTAEKLYIDHRNLPFIVKPRDRVFLDCGRIELTVRGAVDTDIVCEIQNDGDIGENRDVFVLNVPFELPAITEKDKKDISLLIEEGVDAIFASSIINKHGVRDVRKALGEKGRGVLIFTKIESRLAFDNFDEIILETDGIVVNRGKLGIEMSAERVLQAQKTMIAKALKNGKPIFSYTDYLNSMIHRNCPTIAESTDVVNSVIDGLDGIILLDETSKGDDPVIVVKTLSTLAREAEAQLWQWELFRSLDILSCPPLDPAHAICIAAVMAAMKCHAAGIMVVSTSGRSAQLVARYKPRCPIFAITRYGSVARQLSLWRGVFPVHYIAAPNPCYARDVDLRIQYAIEIGKIKGTIFPGDPLVLVNGWRQGSGFTNNIRLVYVSARDPWVYPHTPAPQGMHHQVQTDA
ncbi:unnamed protein product [Nezara viridula]|uniref:Pyruvate kinase n=1 Tax=Nezara viridula TaxID=85310 RepID=A0A9P0HIQ3_NEZVI|nr:unnamed protein product [Nezara viridula]